MKKEILLTLTAVLTVAASTALGQSGKSPTQPTYVTAEDIATVATVVDKFSGGDHEVKIADMGRYNLGIAVVRRGALKPGGVVRAINHTKVTEVYYVVSGEGILITGGDAAVTDIKPIAPDNVVVTTVVGPGNNATFVKPAESREVKTGDVIIIPAGMYHGFSEIPDHIEYVTVRPDLDKVLPGGYINPILKR